MARQTLTRLTRQVQIANAVFAVLTAALLVAVLVQLVWD
jgi:hypothetical protein